MTKITRVEIVSYAWEIKGLRHGRAFHYDPESNLTRTGSVIRLTADDGAVGEYAKWHGNPQAVVSAADMYLGESPFEREFLYQRAKPYFGFATHVMAVYDNAMWDMVGKIMGQPVHALLGTYRTSVPAYCSTIDGAVTGPLSTPETFADFAQECLERGHKGFKIHPMAWENVNTHVDCVLAVADRVGGQMDLLLDSYNLYATFGEALKVGRACDEGGFMWYEDPYSDGGYSIAAHQRLRDLMSTPLLIGEKVHTIEQRMDMIASKATDYARADLPLHGVTGSIKLAHAAELMGIDVEPHAGNVESLHFMAAVKNANYFEVSWVHPLIHDFAEPVYADVSCTGLDAVGADGMIDVPMGPGFGVTLDWDWIQAHETGRIVKDLD